jgi:hypothetical protein
MRSNAYRTIATENIIAIFAPRRVLPIPSGLLFPEVRVQNDPVMRLARFQTCEGFVDLAHGEMLGYGRDLVPRSKVEHGLDGHGRAGRRTRYATLLHHE